MPRSMTGYGRASEDFDRRSITVEIKSVNHRFLETSVRLYRSMMYLEEPVKKAVAAKVSRGKIDINISIEDKNGESVDVSYNPNYLEGYLKTLKEISRNYGIKNNIRMSDIASNRDIFTVERAEDDQEKTVKEVLSVLDAALDMFNASREKEGSRLAEDISGRLDRIEENVEKIKERSPQTVTEYREKLLARMKEVLGDSSIDETRILTEAAIYADKISVAEETTRLDTHIANFRDLLKASGQIGKKMDFYMQEMNREINTIGSKCSDISIATVVVEVKNEFENIREQIQNIE